jgi:hypothetical protein
MTCNFHTLFPTQSSLPEGHLLGEDCQLYELSKAPLEYPYSYSTGTSLHWPNADAEMGFDSDPPCASSSAFVIQTELVVPSGAAVLNNPAASHGAELKILLYQFTDDS